MNRPFKPYVIQTLWVLSWNSAHPQLTSTSFPHLCFPTNTPPQLIFETWQFNFQRKPVCCLPLRFVTLDVVSASLWLWWCLFGGTFQTFPRRTCRSWQYFPPLWSFCWFSITRLIFPAPMRRPLKQTLVWADVGHWWAFCCSVGDSCTCGTHYSCFQL